MASRPPPSSIPSTYTRRDTPWLLPSNRKLRNIISISLRNLSLDAPTPGRRHRGKTIDDDAVPHTLKSPAKMVAMREQRTLEHSRSSSDLKTLAEDRTKSESEEKRIAERGEANSSPSKSNSLQKTPPRPPAIRLRRRSTLEWVNSTPARRQEKLENVTSERLADLFFSLHVEGVEEPIYVSETVEHTMNPTFRHIDLSACGPGITRMDRLTVKVWVRSAAKKSGGQWKQLVELDLPLRSLQYLGKSLDQLYQRLPPNAVIFHLTDGVYTPFISLTDYVPPPAAPPVRAGSIRTLPTSSFDALLRLSKLDDSIQDALATRNKLARDLEALFQRNKEALTEQDEVAEADDRLKTIEYAKKTVEKQLEKARQQANERRASLKARRKLMAEDLALRERESAKMHSALPELPAIRGEAEVKKKAITNQQRRVCEDLQKIYTLEPVPKQALAFSIQGLHLPNSEDFDTEPPDIVAAALGDVAHVVLLLSYYLAQPLPYPVNPRSSTSTIEDPISLLKTNASMTQTYKDDHSLRTYPLFSRGVPRFRFEYAVFLLNKDIQILLESAYSVRVLDIRQTLPNLKYLLYVATAGEGDLPARKAGGVRGLMKARLGSGADSPSLSRMSSGGSTGSTLVGSLLGSAGKGTANGKLKSGGAVESLKRNIDSVKK